MGIAATPLAAHPLAPGLWSFKNKRDELKSGVETCCSANQPTLLSYQFSMMIGIFQGAPGTILPIIIGNWYQP